MLKRKKNIKLLILILVVSNIFMIYQYFILKNKSNDTAYHIHKEKADQLLLQGKIEEAEIEYSKIYLNYPQKINANRTQNIITKKKNEEAQNKALSEQLNEYQNLINSLKEESAISQNQYRKLIKQFNLKNQEQLKNKQLDSIFIALKNLEIQELEEEQNLLLTTKEILELETSNGVDIKYLGDVSGDKANGYGFAIYNRKGYYEGQWLNNKRHGYGTYYWQNGDKYEGDYTEDNRTGIGTYYFNTGEIYIGSWKNNLRDGQGKMLNKKGKVVFDGLWKNDETLTRY